MKKIYRSIIFAGCLLCAACSGNQTDTVNVIPLPAEVRTGRGSLDLRGGLHLVSDDARLAAVSEYVASLLDKTDVAHDGVGNDAPSLSLSLDRTLPPGAYRLSVNSKGIELCGGAEEGVISGAATLQQLLWQEPGRIRCVGISDAPRFAWRGVMLDVSRHFFTPEEVMALMDCMALYKFNRLHLHLTDDQGWRLEIKRYSELTDEGAWRRLNRHDSLCLQQAGGLRDSKYLLPADRVKNVGGEKLYGGFYTQAQMRELIAYAARRGIEIVPEIDLPGHSLAAIGCYPRLSCNGRGYWGEAFSSPLCLGNDATLEFCRNVLTEVFELFPAPYVHIGGDEVDKTSWEHCPKCRQRIVREHLKGTEELQAWFTRSLERFCTEHGKTLIGWDEIADDGLTPESRVLWWRAWNPGTLNRALQDGHRVILSPSEYLYLNEEQDRNSMDKVYGWEPVFTGVPGADTLIVGIQAALWTERVPSFDVAGERLFPRLLAVAETAWTQPEAKNKADFDRRLPLHLQQLARSGWNYRLADVEGVCDRNVFVESARVELTVPDGAMLFYTLDGTAPDTTSCRYRAPFTVDRDCTLTMRCYNSQGVAGEVRTAAFAKTVYADACAGADALPQGILVRWYDFHGECCADIDRSPLKENYISDKIVIPEEVVGDIGLIFDGYIEVPQDGVYAFYTYSDDGSVLEIDGRLIVDNDGLHSRTERSGQAALRRGMHKFSLRYFDSNGGVLEAGMILKDGTRRPLSDKMLKH